MRPPSIKLARNSQGDLGPKDWIKEGDGLYVSARHLWASWLVKARKFEGSEDSRWIRKTLTNHMNTTNGFPKASILLIGYCVEMYLKAGLTRLFIGYPDDIFRRQLRSYSHDFPTLALDVLGTLSSEQKEDLKSLKNFVLNDARYPVEGGENKEYVDRYNKRYSKIFNAYTFKRFCNLAKYIKTQIRKIDSDSTNPCSHSSWDVGSDGFICYRHGGNLASRITYRRCSSETCQAVEVSDIVQLLEANKILLPGRISEYQIFVEIIKSSGKKHLKKIQ